MDIDYPDFLPPPLTPLLGILEHLEPGGGVEGEVADFRL